MKKKTWTLVARRGPAVEHRDKHPQLAGGSDVTRLETSSDYSKS